MVRAGCCSVRISSLGDKPWRSYRVLTCPSDCIRAAEAWSDADGVPRAEAEAEGGRTADAGSEGAEQPRDLSTWPTPARTWFGV